MGGDWALVLRATRRRLPLLVILAGAMIAQVARACETIVLESKLHPFVSGTYALSGYPADASPEQQRFSFNGRPVYASVAEPRRYLFHMQAGDHGGKWLVGSDVGVDSAWAFAGSWATAPHLVPIVSDRAGWRVYPPPKGDEPGAWQFDWDFSARCQAPQRDATLYLKSPKSPGLSGMYSLTAQRVDDRPVYVHARGQLYIYARRSGAVSTNEEQESSSSASYKYIWIVGEQPGDASGLAFLEEEASVAAAGDAAAATSVHARPSHPPAGAGQGWRVAVDGAWVEDSGLSVITSDPELCLEALLQRTPLQQRANSSVPEPARLDGSSGDERGVAAYVTRTNEHCRRHKTTWEVLRMVRLALKLPRTDEEAAARYHELSNGVVLPLVGFGSGATLREDARTAVQQALAAGYRLIDTATAYDNEDIIGELLAEEVVPGATRDSVFVVSKLWYTELGFTQTLDAVARSMERLRSDYVDGYLIHWPRCYPDVEWMECEKIGHEVGTWQDSWRALERLYAEGRLLAVGVSNFDAPLLDSLVGMAATSPQVLQNRRDVVYQDEEAVAKAGRHRLFVQPYSSVRALIGEPEARQYDEARRVLEEIGAAHGRKTVAQVALRWEVQRGHGVIPRSHAPAHLRDNIDVLSTFELSEEEIARIDGLTVQKREKQQQQQQHDEL